MPNLKLQPCLDDMVGGFETRIGSSCTVSLRCSQKCFKKATQVSPTVQSKGKVRTVICFISQIIMKLNLFAIIALCGVAIVLADPHKVVKEWKEKIKNHHFMCKCM